MYKHACACSITSGRSTSSLPSASDHSRRVIHVNMCVGSQQVLSIHMRVSDCNDINMCVAVCSLLRLTADLPRCMCRYCICLHTIQQCLLPQPRRCCPRRTRWRSYVYVLIRICAHLSPCIFIYSIVRFSRRTSWRSCTSCNGPTSSMAS